MQLKYIFKRSFYIIQKEGIIFYLKKILSFFFNSSKIDLDILIKNSPNNLDDIFIKFGTDKGSLDGKKTYDFIYKNQKNGLYKNYKDWINRQNIRNYEYQLGINSTPIYEKIFSKVKNDKLKILEIGVANGHSLASWHHYFPNSQIFGIDLKKPYKFFYKSKRVYYFSINIFDQEKINNFINKHGKFDFIIDDSLNTKEAMFTNLKNFYPSINKGGTYFLEDTGFYDLVQNAHKDIELYNKKNNAKYFYDTSTINEIFNDIKNKNFKPNKVLDKNFLENMYPTIKEVEFVKYDHPHAGMAIIYKH